MRYVIKTLEILAAAASNQSSQSRWLDAAAALQPNQIKINNAISKYPARWRVDAVRISCSYLKSGSSFFGSFRATSSGLSEFRQGQLRKENWHTFRIALRNRVCQTYIFYRIQESDKFAETFADYARA